MQWGTIADWFVVGGTLVVAAVAVFQETIRGWFYRPTFVATIKTEPPDCHSVPMMSVADGSLVSHAIYLRVWIENTGNATANNVEVYAKELRRHRADGKWERLDTFPPMNLRWANLGHIYFPRIAPGMGKHCDVGHIVDPKKRRFTNDEAPHLGLTDEQTSFAFDLMVSPNHKGHIISPGKYQLDILIAAENVSPLRKTLAISLQGAWHADEARMLRDGVGIIFA